jgi:leucyl aminopeptidase (aminopeptidase T)
MPGITMDMLNAGGLKADYNEVESKTNIIADMLTEGCEINIKSAKGCDFTADIKGRKAEADTGVLRKKGSFCNLPAGEGFIAPVEGRASGVLVFDGSFGGIGVLEGELRLEVENGRVENASGYKAKELMEILEGHEHGNEVAEIGIGTNPGARLIGNVLEDEKVFGTAHVAFGDNHVFGGKNRTDIHVDGIIKMPDVILDGEMLIEKGRFLCFQ